jgi:hypothetical protein
MQKSTHEGNGSSTQSIADAAAYYHDKRGTNPVPISRRTKKAFEKGWQNLPYLPERFKRKALNVGIQFGPRSNNLVDVDLDSKGALEFADAFLPETGAMFGRSSKPRSHRLYIADFTAYGETRAAIQFHEYVQGKPGAMIVELRIGAGNKGAQSVAPPSVHERGETIQWVNGIEPAQIDAGALKGAVTRLAVACLLAPRYPELGSRHEAALVLGGVLARAGWQGNDIHHLVATVARAAGCDAGDAHAKTASGAVEAMANGTHVPGIKRLGEVWGGDVVEAFQKWGLGSHTKTSSRHLPELIVDFGDLTETAKQLANMFAQHRHFLFNGNEPIRVVHENEEIPKAIPVTPEAVSVFTHELCTPVKFTEDGKKGITLSNRIANLYLNGLRGRWGLKNFNGVITAPLPSDDGLIRTAAGYDEATGLWCHNIPQVDVPEHPTEEQAKASLDELRRFFRTFAYDDATMIFYSELGVNVVDLTAPIGLDESSALVSLQTAVCRASLPLAPGILANAPAISGSGTGKGLWAKAICAAATGFVPSAFTSGHDEKEFEKRLAAELTDARPAIFLDNYNGKNLTSDTLASALTENPCEVRPMGHTAVVKLHTQTLRGTIAPILRTQAICLASTCRHSVSRTARSSARDRAALHVLCARS